jgi:DNA-binding Lrp family transcriptional regulator
MAIKLDEIDKNILNILQRNAKITNSQLAKEVGLSPAPTLERVKKLENLGVIKSYHAELDQDLMGLGVCVLIQATLQGSDKIVMESFKKRIQEIPQVIECHHITGSSDFMLKILSRNMKSYNEFILDELIELKEIGNLQSMVVLSTVKDSKVLPLN